MSIFTVLVIFISRENFRIFVSSLHISSLECQKVSMQDNLSRKSASYLPCASSSPFLKGGSTLISREDAFSIYLEERVVS